MYDDRDSSYVQLLVADSKAETEVLDVKCTIADKSERIVKFKPLLTN